MKTTKDVEFHSDFSDQTHVLRRDEEARIASWNRPVFAIIGEAFPMSNLNGLRRNDMMRHPIDVLSQGQEIGHYGRLVFAMVGQHFMNGDELTDWLARDRAFSKSPARALVDQVR